MKRRRQKSNKQLLLTQVFLVLLLFVGIGYSILNTTLGINGNIQLAKPPCKVKNKLYNVIKCEAKENGLAKEYTGAHQDSMTGIGDKKIYHWYGSNAANGTAITNMNNVIFANHCWQMIRTTDTGGVRLIYNGEVDDNKCLNTRSAHVGYSARTTQTLSDTYYYGTSYVYNKDTNAFNLAGEITKGDIKEGTYTCKSTSENGTCSNLYLVDTISSGTTYYVLPLTGYSQYSQFGKLQFNQETNSPAYIGYKYNKIYIDRVKHLRSSELMLSTATINTQYWYADSITWGSPIADKYNLNNPSQITDQADYSSLVDKYTFRDTRETYTNDMLYYITAVNDDKMYYIELSNSPNHNLADYNFTYTYGDSYTYNGNGTYTINNPRTIEKKDWYNEYNNIGSDKYVCKNAVNNTCSDLWYTTSTTATSMVYIHTYNNYKYASGFTYNGSTNTYTLNDDSVNFWNMDDSKNQATIKNHHYTCWNTTGECSTISYIYLIYSIYKDPYYIDITDGKSVYDALNEMLYDDDVNTINSTIKTGIDAWYKKYMIEYTSYLEDTIYCTDRSQRSQSTSGWNPDGGDIHQGLLFNNDSRNKTSDLSCTNITDKFSLNNSKAKLEYPVGLITLPEINIMNNININRTGADYWVNSPCYADRDTARGWSISYTGTFGVESTNWPRGVRPSISLKPGIEFTTGDGSMNNPYVVKLD